jgi:2-polyprenyl-6-hydroxyphenyl methylase/3-demethylubiquinone-9 3-methyltransferase
LTTSFSKICGQVHDSGYSYDYDNRRLHTAGLVTDVLTPGDRIVDNRAAQENFSLLLAEMGYEVTWNDLRFELADWVWLNHERGRRAYAPSNAFELRFPQPSVIVGGVAP